MNRIIYKKKRKRAERMGVRGRYVSVFYSLLCLIIIILFWIVVGVLLLLLHPSLDNTHTTSNHSIIGLPNFNLHSRTSIRVRLIKTSYSRVYKTTKTVLSIIFLYFYRYLSILLEFYCYFIMCVI